MTKGKVILIIVAVLLVAAIVTGAVVLRPDERSPKKEKNTDPTVETTTAPTTEPAETTEEKQLYWVFAQGGLWVRQGPGTQYELVGSLDDGENIEVLEWKDGWVYIEEPVKGWCSGDYIHKLGWYKDVKTPEGTPPADQSLKGKWVHVTTPAEENGVVTCTAGIFRLRSNGTFIHRVDEYQKNAEGKWEMVNQLVDHPYWVGEYSFDGKQLVLNYMAELVETYDAAGESQTREWVEWIYTLTIDVTKSGDVITIPNGDEIPLTVANEHAMPTENYLYPASGAVGTPEDVCAVLNLRYS